MGGEGGTTWGENGTKGKMCGFLFTDFNRYVLYKNLLDGTGSMLIYYVSL